LRLEAIVKTMKQIASWSTVEREQKMSLANQIAAYNRKHFFSSKFVDQVTDELKNNLRAGIIELEDTNTASWFLNRRKELLQYPAIKEYYLKLSSRQDTVKILKKARSYYMRRLPKD